jgi:hypothetical protein
MAQPGLALLHYLHILSLVRWVVVDNPIHIMGGSNNNTGNAIVHVDHDIIMKGTYSSY